MDLYNWLDILKKEKIENNLVCYYAASYVEELSIEQIRLNFIFFFYSH